MRILKISAPALLLAGVLLHAADAPKPTTVPAPPPIPAAGAEDDKVLEPTVTVIQKEDATVTEYRLGGKVYMIKVKPKDAPEYTLVDETGDGNMVHRDPKNHISPPMWVIKRF